MEKGDEVGSHSVGSLQKAIKQFNNQTIIKMIRQLFKLMWNSKRNHSLLIIEIFFSFLVLFGVMSFIISQYANYVEPMGFEGDNVWVVWFENANAEGGSLSKQKENMLNRIETFEEVDYVTVSENAIPFGGTRNSQSLKKGEVEVWSRYFFGDANYEEVLEIPLTEGKWFDKNTDDLKYEPVIINQRLREELFGNETAIGQILNPEDQGRPKKVVGVIGNFRWGGDFHKQENIYFAPVGKDRISTLLVKVKPTVTAEFEGQLSKTISGIAKGYQIEIERLVDKRKTANNLIYIPSIILLTVCGFLIFNVILGLFGILWANINKRKGEIGTRRAMGATQMLIAGQFVGEVMVIATFALILGCFFAVQFPLMNVFGLANSIYIKAILVSILVIYFLVGICAFYPSWQASKIHPAIALHAD